MGRESEKTKHAPTTNKTRTDDNECSSSPLACVLSNCPIAHSGGSINECIVRSLVLTLTILFCVLSSHITPFLSVCVPFHWHGIAHSFDGFLLNWTKLDYIISQHCVALQNQPKYDTIQYSIQTLRMGKDFDRNGDWMGRGRKGSRTAKREKAQRLAQKRTKGPLQPILQRCLPIATTECRNGRDVKPAGISCEIVGVSLLEKRQSKTYYIIVVRKQPKRTQIIMIVIHTNANANANANSDQ